MSRGFDDYRDAHDLKPTPSTFVTKDHFRISAGLDVSPFRKIYPDLLGVFAAMLTTIRHDKLCDIMPVVKSGHIFLGIIVAPAADISPGADHFRYIRGAEIVG
jgi:hypothetical protein